MVKSNGMNCPRPFYQGDLIRSTHERMVKMKTVRISDETYDMARGFLARSLEVEMLHGRVEEWDETNCALLRALIELETHVVKA